MAKNITEIVKKIQEYINTYIVGRENTVIEECMACDKVFNRGHAIQVKVKLPESIRNSKDIREFCLTYYVEEIMARYPNSTAAAMGEIINSETNIHYPETMKILEQQIAATEKTVDDYQKSDIIITAMPSSLVTDKMKKGFITKDAPEFGLTLFMKGCINKDSRNGQIYAVPVNDRKDRIITEKDWKNAEINSIKQADVAVNYMLSFPAKTKNISIMGEVTDKNSFYDYFYLLSYRQLWKAVADNAAAEEIYIIPNNAYKAVFIIKSKRFSESREAEAAYNNILVAFKYKTDENIPIYKFDCNTMTITKMER